MPRRKTEKPYPGVEHIPLPSWKTFVRLVYEDLLFRPAYVYRGHGNPDWRLVSTIDRWEADYPRYRHYSGNPDYFDHPPAERDVHLRAFRTAARGRVAPHLETKSNLEWWCSARHHELKAPLLDWTLSPFVALYFAFTTPVRSNRRVVYALSSSGINNFKGEPRPRVFVPVSDLAARVRSQLAVFLYMPKRCDLECLIESESPKADGAFLRQMTVLTRYEIRDQKQDRTDCLRFLNLMNINEMTLFPELDGAARYINSLWELNFDTSLGYLDESIPERWLCAEYCEYGALNQ